MSVKWSPAGAHAMALGCLPNSSNPVIDYILPSSWLLSTAHTRQPEQNQGPCKFHFWVYSLQVCARTIHCFLAPIIFYFLLFHGKNVFLNCILLKLYSFTVRFLLPNCVQVKPLQLTPNFENWILHLRHWKIILLK